MRIHGQRGIGLELAHLVGPAADRLARIIEPGSGLVEGALADDAGAERGKPAFQRHVRRGVDHAHGVAVDDLDAVKRGEQAARDGRDFARQVLIGRRGDDLAGERQGLALHRRAGLAEHALRREGGCDVLGGELIAVVHLHALAERELDGLVVDPLPLGGEARLGLQLALVVEVDQPLDEHRHHAGADVGLFAQRVQRVGIGDLLHRDGDGRAGVGLRNSDARQAGAGGNGQGVAAGQAHG